MKMVWTIAITTAILAAVPGIWWHATHRNFDLSAGEDVYAIIPDWEMVSAAEWVKVGNIIYSRDGIRWRCGLIDRDRQVSCRRDSQPPSSWWPSNLQTAG